MSLVQSLTARAQRFVPRRQKALRLTLPDGSTGIVENVSTTGLGAMCFGEESDWQRGRDVADVGLSAGGRHYSCGPARVVRAESRGDVAGLMFVGLQFDRPQPGLAEALEGAIQPERFVLGELRRPPACAGDVDAYATTIDKFFSGTEPDVFAKCTAFRGWIDSMMETGIYQRLYRLTVMGALDHRVTVLDRTLEGEREFICFDSNSYLGLHRHPKVIERVIEVTRNTGYGMPSAQLLCGTNRYLCELEEALSEFHGREATLVFPSGFAANIGALGALLRAEDAVFRDQFAHASIHEGCRSSRALANKVFPHNDMEALEALLVASQEQGCQGKLIVTDGVFSMHGRIAPIPDLVRIARRHGARLMIDDAHGLGVLGPTGGGIEEHFQMPGAADVLMGTLSKALGAIGGYVTGSRDLVNYLRFFAASGFFTTTLPAPMCAGLSEALRLVRDEPEHVQQLWRNIRHFVPALRSAGFIVPEPVSPITTVFMGDHGFMYHFSRDLFDAGVKCGNVQFPAVPKGSSILRLTINARHTLEDLDYTIDVLTKIGKKFGILNRTPEEIREIGRKSKTQGGAAVFKHDRPDLTARDAPALL